MVKDNVYKITGTDFWDTLQNAQADAEFHLSDGRPYELLITVFPGVINYPLPAYDYEQIRTHAYYEIQCHVFGDEDERLVWLAEKDKRERIKYHDKNLKP